MYPHFIEVHDKEDDILVSINIDCIANFFPKGDGDGAIINCRDCGGQITTETYDELKKLITNAGCHIEKGDPRLDQSKPLTMNDLKDMVGQPVWDSNRNVWYLFKAFDEDGQAYFTDVFGNTGIAENNDALIKYPIYRMKR